MDGRQIENDDWPILLAIMTDAGQNATTVFSLLRQTLGLSPAAAKSHLQSRPIQIARGSRMEIESIVERFKNAGATVDVRRERAD